MPHAVSEAVVRLSGPCCPGACGLSYDWPKHVKPFVLFILCKPSSSPASNDTLLTMTLNATTSTTVTCTNTATCSVFMWGAKSGEEQLPPFPEPTHRGIRNSGQLGDKQQLLVDFPSEAARQNALPVVRGQLPYYKPSCLFLVCPLVCVCVCVCVCTCVCEYEHMHACTYHMLGLHTLGSAYVMPAVSTNGLSVLLPFQPQLQSLSVHDASRQ